MIGGPGFPVRRWQDNALAWFDQWFASAACVWQTLFACLIVCIVEVMWPHLDPHYFYLLAILTVYSAVTQPALAQSNALANAKLEEVLTDLHTIIDRQSGIIDTLRGEVDELGEVLEGIQNIEAAEEFAAADRATIKETLNAKEAE